MESRVKNIRFWLSMAFIMVEFLYLESKVDSSEVRHYFHKGCYGDKPERALSIFVAALGGKNRKIEQCYWMTKAKGFKVFGVQDNRECWSDPNGECFYNKHGNASNCNDGTGGMWANDVYFIDEPTCNNYALCTETFHTGLVIVGSVLGRYQAYSELHCADKCLRDRLCRAYNYQVSRQPHICETVTYKDCQIKSIERKSGFGFRIFQRNQFKKNFGFQFSSTTTDGCAVDL